MKPKPSDCADEEINWSRRDREIIHRTEETEREERRGERGEEKRCFSSSILSC
jgi:hypothetical protein